MRKPIGAVALVATALALAASGAFAHTPGGDGAANDRELLKDEKQFLQQSSKTYDGGTKAVEAWNMEVVAHNDLGGRGFNADVWAHKGFAYVGHWGFTDWSAGSKTRFCPSYPNNGVAIVDSRTNERVGTLQNPDGTSAEDVVVFTAKYGPHRGRDIAAAGLQVCGGSRYDTSVARGLMLWDVTNPSSPVQLGFVNTGCCTRGLHEFEVEHRADLRKTFAYATVPASQYPDSASPTGVRDQLNRGDFRLIDITNPAAPVEVSDWKVQQVGGPFAAIGCDADGNYGHGAEPSHDGKLVFLSYWDSGYIRLDVTNPANPVFTGTTTYPAGADGDAHSSQYDEERKLLFTADEDFYKTCSGTETGYGYMRVYDYANPSAPRQIGTFRTPNSLGLGSHGSGDYTIHNNFLVGTDVYVAWYSDGVRVVDASDPTTPREVAYFVPPAGQNPVKPSQRFVLSQAPQVWGVVVRDGLVYASDMNSGLWILRRTG